MDADGSGCDGTATTPMVAPDAAEACDGIDNDCDGDIDEGGSITLVPRRGRDGYGLP